MPQSGVGSMQGSNEDCLPMKVKVEDLEGLLTQKHGMIVMKVKVEDLQGLGGSSNIQEYQLLLFKTHQMRYKRS